MNNNSYNTRSYIPRATKYEYNYEQLINRLLYNFIDNYI